MNIQLIEGEFSSKDALDLVTQMIQVKIKFHEAKISNSDSEEDIKARETKIKRLQNELHECRTQINGELSSVKLNSVIGLE